MNKAVEEFDVAIVGAGFVGLTLAIALSKYGYKVAIIEKKQFLDTDCSSLSIDELCKKLDTIKDNRGIALSHTSLNILSSLGVYQYLEKYLSPIKTVYVSEKGSFGRVKINSEDYGFDRFGSVICADRLLKVLQFISLEDSNIKIFSESSINKISNLFQQDNVIDIKKHKHYDSNTSTYNWELEVLSGKNNNKLTINANLLVAADGANSYLRKYFNIGVDSKRFDKTALVFNLVLEGPHKGVAFQRFDNKETLALVPFGENTYKCIYIVPDSKLEYINSLDPQATINLIKEKMSGRLDNVVSIGKYFSYPLRQTISQKIIADNLVFVGNSANAVHPVAAQGLNLGLRDIAILAENIVETKAISNRKKYNIALKKYEQQRYSDHKVTVNLSSKLASVFDINLPLASNIRSSVMLGVGLSDFVKNWVVKQGIGQNKFVSKLACGIELT